MSFTRLDDLRSSFQGGGSSGDLRGRRSRGLFRRGAAAASAAEALASPLSSPLFRRKQLNLGEGTNGVGDFSGCVSGPPSLASSRESSLDRAHWGRVAMGGEGGSGSRL